MCPSTRMLSVLTSIQHVAVWKMSILRSLSRENKLMQACVVVQTEHFGVHQIDPAPALLKEQFPRTPQDFVEYVLNMSSK